jgi:hypothetical protein
VKPFPSTWGTSSVSSGETTPISAGSVTGASTRSGVPLRFWRPSRPERLRGRGR